MTLPAPTLEAMRASAGSGKTYSLTTRYLRILQRGETPDRVLATTFTRKAAGEILGRVLQRLAEAADAEAQSVTLARDLGDPRLSREDFRRQLAGLCRTLHRVSISTLDSFFSRLSQSFRHELQFPAGAMLMESESPTAMQLRLEAVRAVLAEGPLDELIVLLDQLQQGRAQSSVTHALDGLISRLYEVFRQAPREAWFALRVPDAPGDEEVARLLSALDRCAAVATDKRLAKAILGDAQRARDGEWAGFLGRGLAPKVLENLTYYNKPFPEEVAMLYHRLIDRGRAELIQRIGRQTEATYHLLRRFDLHYQELRRRRRALLFSDVPYALSAFLTDRPLDEVAYRLDGRVDHLLLDEFQDTSPEQWEILRPFARRIAERSAGGAAAARSLFCVGDVKQAIYGWRGGCAEIFNQLDADLDGLAWESTERSYRSSQVVLDAVNRVFGTLTTNPILSECGTDAEGWQAGFQHHVAVKSLPGYVELVTSPAAPAEEELAENAAGLGGGERGGEENGGDARPGGHEQFVAERIAELAQQHPAASIGVLMRTNDAVRRMIFLLQKRNVNASGEGGSPVDDDPAVEAILAALTLADHPGDTAALFHVSSTPLAPLLGLENDRPEHAAEVARRIRTRLLSEGYAAVVGEWARRLAPECDVRGAQRLAQLVDLAELHEAGSSLRPADFVRFVRATAVEEPVPARVRVMSIHKSKGLEFDIVVLPELHKKIAAIPPLLLVDRPAPTRPIRAVYRCPDKDIRAAIPELQQAYADHRSREIRESLCLLYVAMTRARSTLHLVIPPLQQTEKGAVRKESLSHAAILRAALRAPDVEEGFEGEQVLFRAGDPGWDRGAEPLSDALPSTPTVPLAPVRLAPPDGTERRGWREIHPSELENGGRVSAARLLELEDTEAQRFGTLIHAWFEQVTWAGEPLPADEELLRIAARIVPDQEEAWVAASLASFHEMLELPGVREALRQPELAAAGDAGEAAPTVELWRERPFAARVEGALMQGIFDRVVLHRRGDEVTAAEILDFKTDDVSGDLSRVVETYRPQLDAYRRALSVLLDLPLEKIAARLLLVRTGAVVIL